MWLSCRVGGDLNQKRKNVTPGKLFVCNLGVLGWIMWHMLATGTYTFHLFFRDGGCITLLRSGPMGSCVHSPRLSSLLDDQ